MDFDISIRMFARSIGVNKDINKVFLKFINKVFFVLIQRMLNSCVKYALNRNDNKITLDDINRFMMDNGCELDDIRIMSKLEEYVNLSRKYKDRMLYMSPKVVEVIANQIGLPVYNELSWYICFLLQEIIELVLQNGVNGSPEEESQWLYDNFELLVPGMLINKNEIHTLLKETMYEPEGLGYGMSGLGLHDMGDLMKMMMTSGLR